MTILSFTHTFSQADFDEFARLSGDDNPIHVDLAFSARTKFGRTVAHGMLLYSLISRGLAAMWPDTAVIQQRQELMFTAPTFTDGPVTFSLKTTGAVGETAVIQSTITRPDGTVTCRGETAVAFHSRFLAPAAAPEPVASEMMAMKGLRVGDTAVIRRTFSAADLGAYAGLTGDDNLIFLDDGAAKKMGMDGRTVPGGLLGGLFSNLLGTELPGRGTNWLKQSFVFHRGVGIEVAVTAVVEITRLRPDKQLVNLRTTCTNPAQQPVCTGEALVWVSDLE